MKKYTLLVSLLALASSAVAMEKTVVTFKSTDGTEYSIKRTTHEPFCDSPVMTTRPVSELFSVEPTKDLPLDLKPEDVIQIFVYTRSHPALEIYHLKSVGKKFSANSLNGNIVLLHKDGFSTQKDSQ